MSFPIQLSSASITVLALVLPATLLAALFLHRPNKTNPRTSTKPQLVHRSDEAATRLSKQLSTALPDSVIYPDDAEFATTSSTYWAKQASETIPTCIIRPQNVAQLSTAVKILAAEHAYRTRQRKASKSDSHDTGIFAVRSGGHSPVARAASIQDGTLVDMSLFSQVMLSEDNQTVIVGTGARWGKVYEELDAKGLAVVGGRNSTVGVGGLLLGGGISFFSPRFGFVCSNALSYEVVLADGSIVTASDTENSDLWCALKGGGNNFGIVTNVALRAFASSKIWSGFLYMTSHQTQNVLSAFYDSINRATSDAHDPYAAGPIACFTYLHQLRVQAVSVNLVYTSPSKDVKAWPKYWAGTSFKSLWRLWSTFKVRTLADACDEMNALNPPGRRQVFGTITIKNDEEMLHAVHRVWSNSIADIKRADIKTMSWTLVLQPCFSQWGCKGDTNPLGFNDDEHEPLVNVSLTVNWGDQEYDDEAERITKETIKRIEKAAADMGTGHRYRYMNYCGAWQKPFESYGDENVAYLKQVSRKYDPHGVFQQACVGGFKLDWSGETV